MRKFWKSQWGNYIDSIDWHDVTYTQCRPINLLIILIFICGVEIFLVYKEVFENIFYPIIAMVFGILAIGLDLIIWKLKDNNGSQYFVIPLLMGLEGLLYSICLSITALGLSFEIYPYYRGGLWAFYFCILMYWGTIASLTLICSIFLLSGSFICIIILGTNPFEYLMWGLFVLVYIIMAGNTGHKKTVKATKTAMRTVNEILERYYQQSRVIQSLMSHDLKGRISVALTNAQVLQMTSFEDLDTLGRHEYDSIINDIVKASTEARDLLMSYLKSNKSSDGVEYFILSKITTYNLGKGAVRFGKGIPDIPIIGSLEHFIFVLKNLVDNALEAGATEVDIRVFNINKKEKSIVLAVKDNGSGVDSSRQEVLFSPTKSFKPNGTGLGLFLSRQLLRGYGGDLEFASDVFCDGTVFLITLKMDLKIYEGKDKPWKRTK